MRFLSGIKFTVIVCYCISIIACKKAELLTTSLKIHVVDTLGQNVADAKVYLHKNKDSWASWRNPIDSIYTNAYGDALFNNLSDTVRYYFNITSGESTNRFTKYKLTNKLLAFEENKLTVAIRPYTEWEKIMGGNAHLKWKLLKLKNINGVPFFDYPVITDMYMDGRWYDSNGRLGLWWFSADNKKIYYDYAATGAVVESEMINLTPALFEAKINFFGIIMLIDMVPV